MALLDPPMETRLRAIEGRVSNVESGVTDIQITLAEIKAKLDAVPSRWMQWLFALAILIPMYGILVTLLWTTIHH